MAGGRLCAYPANSVQSGPKSARINVSDENLNKAASDFLLRRDLVEGGCFKVQAQEFCQRNQIVDSSTTAARLSLPSSKAKLAWLLLRRQLYVLRLI
jgi:hypothetical protein